MHEQLPRRVISPDNLKGKVGMTNGKYAIKIFPEYVPVFLSLGYWLGFRPAPRGSKPNLKGRKWINDGTNELRVAPSDLQQYLDNGFLIGRLQSNIDGLKKGWGGTVWMFKEQESIKPKQEEVEQLLADGWAFGRSRLKKLRTKYLITKQYDESLKTSQKTPLTTDIATESDSLASIPQSLSQKQL